MIFPWKYGSILQYHINSFSCKAKCGFTDLYLICQILSCERPCFRASEFINIDRFFVSIHAFVLSQTKLRVENDLFQFTSNLHAFWDVQLQSTYFLQFTKKLVHRTTLNRSFGLGNGLQICKNHWNTSLIFAHTLLASGRTSSQRRRAGCAVEVG